MTTLQRKLYMRESRGNLPTPASAIAVAELLRVTDDITQGIDDSRFRETFEG